MPRKKTAGVAGDPAAQAPAAVLAIACPACKSKIGSDGKTLHEKSAYLEELLETDAGVDEVEKNIGALEKQLCDRDATIADLRAKLEAHSRPAAPAPHNETAHAGP